MRIRRDRIPAVEPHSKNVAEALRAAADLNQLSSEVTIGHRIDSGGDSSEWSSIVRQEIEELMGVLPDFTEAKVKLAGVDKHVNLLRSTIQHTVDVSLFDRRKVGPAEAAVALFEAYAHEQGAINHALEKRDGR